jgi:hypothetical protein
MARPYGYAAAHAYSAYKDPLFLTYAIDSWWFGRAHTIFPEDVAAGTIGVKDFSIAQDCQDSAFFSIQFCLGIVTDRGQSQERWPVGHSL